MVFNQPSEYNTAANHIPSHPPAVAANQRLPRTRRTNSQEPIAMAPPGSGNLSYLDFIPHMDFRQPTETFE